MTSIDTEVLQRGDSRCPGARFIELALVYGSNMTPGNFAEVYRSGFSKGYQDGFRVGVSERAERAG